MLEKEKDWTELLPELIQIIAKKLPDLLDFIRFRATCKTWLFSTPLSDPPPQFPWFLELLEERYGLTDDTLSEKQRFYSVSSNQDLSIRLNKSKILHSWIEGGALGHYLPFADLREETLSFFNPLSKDQFLLPRPFLAPYNPWMVWNGTDPIRNRTIILVNYYGWVCYDPHRNKWAGQNRSFYKGCSCCYWRGMFFSTYVSWETRVFDVSSRKLLHKILPPQDELIKHYTVDKGNLSWHSRKSYLVESLGIILRVSWFHEKDKKIEEASMFHINRLEFDGLDGKPCWVRVDNIGNQILFLHNMNGFSMSATPSTGFREGCIYFINPDDDKPYVHDILAGTFERVPCPFKRCTWFLPSLC